jgi:uncharacterized membrane protein YbhN (UPF0104 family)
MLDAPGSAAASTDEGRPGRRRWRLLRALAVLAVLAAAVWYFRDLDLQALRSALAAADWRLVLLAALLALGPLMVARALRWRALLPVDPASGGHPGVGFLYRVNLGAFAASNVLPFRAGEALRIAALRSRTGAAVSVLIAVQLVEKLIEALSLTTFALPVALWPRPAALPAVFGLACAGGMTVYGLSRLARLRLRPLRWAWLARVAGALHTLESRRAWAVSFGWATVADAVDLAMVGLCLGAVGLHVGPLTWCAILVGVNLAILLPSSPGQVGLVEAGAVMVLAGAGVSQPRALAFALLYHAAHLIPVTLVGGAALAVGELGRRPGAAAARPGASEAGRSG